MPLISESRIIGTWDLLSWYNELSDRSKTYPMGDSATGKICYTDGGFVYVHISAENRDHFVINDPFNATDSENTAAAKSHISYCGTFEQRGTEILHFVEIASIPNWVGTVQRRNYEFLGDDLVLSAEGAKFAGHNVTACLHWRRSDHNRT